MYLVGNKNQTNFLSNIEISVEKASRVVFALRSYLNTELNLHKSEVDLVKEIEKAFHVYDNYIIGKMTVKKEYPKELKFNCIAENFTGVWKNFIFNAVQATYNTKKKLEVKTLSPITGSSVTNLKQANKSQLQIKNLKTLQYHSI